LAELSDVNFMEVIDDKQASSEKIKRILLCSGKIYYELFIRKGQKLDDTTAIIRVEQLYPFPLSQINNIIEKYEKAESIIWVQEEPVNMGAWSFISSNYKIKGIRVIARPPSASPATGASKFHKIQQQKIIEKAFEECNCENVCNECMQLCVTTLMKSEL